MRIQLTITAALALLVSGGAMADAYKCRLESGRISYQSTSCPQTASQDIVRIYSNSTRIDQSSRASNNPAVASIMARQAARDQALKERADRLAAKEEQVRVAALLEAKENEELRERRCIKFTALYDQRVKLQGVQTTDWKTGEVTVDQSADALEMIETTRLAKNRYCGTN